MMRVHYEADGEVERIDIDQEVYEAAKKLDTLDQLRGFDSYNFAEILVQFHQRLLDQLLAADPDDHHWIAVRKDEIAFWSAVVDYMKFIEFQAEQGVLIKVIPTPDHQDPPRL